MHPPFFICIRKNGTLRELPELPEPSFHKYMHAEDWESYERAKKAEEALRKREEQTIAASIIEQGVAKRRP